ncbi:hypothetical protein CLAVI_000247 [Candidatus Clavichlamydia salmonicola]|uniref:hypothetical protein n=1 Tax=Candidatus Clavichlamydia salmonicola TaxID=469812 RepID=UPI0018913940|nr:hypothetical protein [Candidatus Clavichlamydia salmonicola]MBF5050633.1 hypothetical protein [Candidatus Clavichlamydia salmonicola]
MNNRSLNNCIIIFLVAIVTAPHLFLWVYAQHQRKNWKETIRVLEVAKTAASNHRHYLLLSNKKNQESAQHLIVEKILNGMPLLTSSSMQDLEKNRLPPLLNLHLSNSMNDPEKLFITQKNTLIDIHDLHTILKIIEKGYLASPNFFTTNFSVQRQSTFSKDAIFDLQFSLLKRAP